MVLQQIDKGCLARSNEPSSEVEDFLAKTELNLCWDKDDWKDTGWTRSESEGKKWKREKERFWEYYFVMM